METGEQAIKNDIVSHLFSRMKFFHFLQINTIPKNEPTDIKNASISDP